MKLRLKNKLIGKRIVYIVQRKIFYFWVTIPRNIKGEPRIFLSVDEALEFMNKLKGIKYVRESLKVEQ